ncbi:MAG: MFS transporter [Erysipelotrichaceae bacterium]|nr:MFS transporter [Erysipelotrichaceae bacterium]
MKEKRRFHYAWVIMIALIFLKIGAGATSCMTGNFITPVVNELGCKVNEFTLFLSIDAVGMSVFYVPAAKIINSKRKLGITIGIATLLEVIGIAMMYTYKSVWGFYVSGFLVGSAGAFTGYVAIPVIINMWFKKKAGTVLGIIIALGNASTVAFGLLSARFITLYGWRMAYLLVAILGFILMVPEVFFLLKTPEEVGCRPYGEEDEEESADKNINDNQWGLTRKEAFTKASFWLAWLTCLCYSYGTAIPGYIATCTTMELLESTEFGARVHTCVSIGAILCSIILGRLNDRFGVKAGCLWGAVFSLIGYNVIIMGFTNHMLLFVGAFLVGLANSMYAVQAPLLAKEIVGTKHYPDIWSVMMVGNSLIGGGLLFTVGYFYDYGHTYKGAFILGSVFYVFAMLVAFLAIRLSKKYKPVNS